MITLYIPAESQTVADRRLAFYQDPRTSDEVALALLDAGFVARTRDEAEETARIFYGSSAEIFEYEFPV